MNAFDANRIVVIQLADFRGDFQGDAVVVDDRGREGQANTELLVFDGDGVAAGTGHRNRHFAAGQEGRALAAHGHQARARQGIGEAAAFQGVDQCLDPATAKPDVEAVSAHRQFEDAL